MLRTTLLHVLGFGLCGTAIGCGSDLDLPEYPLDGINVYVGFDEPICGGTFDWIEERLRWLEVETGLPASAAPISFYWLREDVFDHCPSGACTRGDAFYTPLEVFSHELVHGHLAQLGRPLPWLTEGMAQMLEDSQWDVFSPMTPSIMLEATDSLDIDYTAAASFVQYLRDRFGMAAVIELYAALDRVDAQATPEVFLAVMGESWGAVEDDFLDTNDWSPVGSINCDFPELAPDDSGTWTLPVAPMCEDAATVGPFLGWDDADSPHTKRHVILEIPEAGMYSLTMTSSATASIEILDCDVPVLRVSRFGTQLAEEIEMVPGRKRLVLASNIADRAVGEVVIRGPLPAP